MLYLDFGINPEDILSETQKKFPKFFRSFLSFIKKFSGQVLKYKISGKDVVVISKLNNRTFRKLDKIFKLDVTKTVCICDELMRNSEFINYLEEKNLKVINGRWLFKFMFLEIVNYISEQIAQPIETFEISILTDDNNSLIFQSIKRLSDKVKNINIITNNRAKFKRLEEQLYEEKGLILNVTNNMRKGTLKSNIIFNINFSQEEFDKITFPRNAVIVNFEEETVMRQKSFNGINSNFFCINLPPKYKEIYSKLNRFGSVNLYESFIYKRTPLDNIWREIANDKIQILSLEGKNGSIRFSEFEKQTVKR